MGLAAGCRISSPSIFARKHYFYPDLPKGYQISQYEQPLCVGGAVEIDLEDGTRRTIGITRIHVEEDAGKSMHDRCPRDPGRREPLRRAADRDRDGAGHPLRARGGAHASADPSAGDLPRGLRREHGGREPAVRRQRVRAPGGRHAVRDEDRTEEHELLPVRRTRAGVRDRATDPPGGGGGDSESGDAPLGSRQRSGLPDAEQGGGARLPLFSRTGPRAGGRRRRVDRTRARGPARAPGGAPRPVRQGPGTPACTMRRS